MNLWWIAGGVVVVVILFAVFWPIAGQRLLAALSGQVSKWSDWVWRRDPVAVMQGEIDKYAGDIREATEGIEEYNGGKHEAQRRLENAEREVNRLTVRVQKEMDKGNEEKALEYAAQLKKAEDDRNYKKNVRDKMDGTFQANMKKIKTARKKIEEKREAAQRLGEDLDFSQVEVTTAKLAQKLNVSDLSGSNLHDAEEEIHKQISANRARVEVMESLSEDQMKEEEENESDDLEAARDILDRFRKPTENTDEKKIA